MNQYSVQKCYLGCGCWVSRGVCEFCVLIWQSSHSSGSSEISTRIFSFSTAQAGSRHAVVAQAWLKWMALIPASEWARSLLFLEWLARTRSRVFHLWIEPCSFMGPQKFPLIPNSCFANVSWALYEFSHAASSDLAPATLQALYYELGISKKDNLVAEKRERFSVRVGENILNWYPMFN